MQPLRLARVTRAQTEALFLFADDVAKIVIHGSQATVDHVGWPYRPQSLTSAQMNLPFCVATLLCEGDVFVDQFSDDVVADPRRLTLARRVEVCHDPAITARGAKFRHMVRVEVELLDGTRLAESLEAPRGSERKFASESDVLDKFRKLTQRVLPPAQSDRIAELVLTLETLQDVGVLAAELAKRS